MHLPFHLASQLTMSKSQAAELTDGVVLVYLPSGQTQTILPS